MEIQAFRLTGVEEIKYERCTIVIETIYRGVITIKSGWLRKKITEREVFGVSVGTLTPSFWRFCDTGEWTPGNAVENLVSAKCCGKKLSQFKAEVES